MTASRREMLAEAATRDAPPAGAIRAAMPRVARVEAADMEAIRLGAEVLGLRAEVERQAAEIAELRRRLRDAERRCQLARSQPEGEEAGRGR